MHCMKFELIKFYLKNLNEYCFHAAMKQNGFTQKDIDNLLMETGIRIVKWTDQKAVPGAIKLNYN